MRVRLVLLVVTLFVSSPPGFAEEGHSHDHAAEAGAGELGTVDFPITCVPEVKADFERALALLHSFGYEPARNGFLAVTERDPGCGIAWWGVAMSYYHPIWAPPTAEELPEGKKAAEKAASAGARSEREKGYIDAIGVFYRDVDRLDHKTRAQAYRQAMEALTKRFPDDDEAKIFFALSLLGTAPPNDTTLAQQKQAAKILTPLVTRHPKHPGVAHYIIHSFDYPGLARFALPAARRYAKIAPASPHAQHMPSHIFTRLGLWPESIRSNLDSEASANALMRKTHPGATHFDALHALDYLVYAYLQIGDEETAKKTLDRALAAKQIDDPNFAAGYAIATAPARYALERHQWAEAARLPYPAATLPWDRFSYALGNLYFARAVGAARSADLDGARKALGELQTIQKGLAKAPPAGPYDWAGQVESLRLAAAGVIARAEGRSDEALSLLRKAADLQDKVGKHPVTPGEVLPAREILADALLEANRPKEALAEYEATLASSPGRRNALHGASQAADASGDEKRAKAFNQQLAAQRVAK